LIIFALVKMHSLDLVLPKRAKAIKTDDDRWIGRGADGDDSGTLEDPHANQAKNRANYSGQ
jgi:hypothetical protein